MKEPKEGKQQKEKDKTQGLMSLHRKIRSIARPPPGFPAFATANDSEHTPSL